MKAEYFLIKAERKTMEQVVEFVKPFFMEGVSDMACFDNKKDMVEWLGGVIKDE